jgi:hypothetical protein
VPQQFLYFAAEVNPRSPGTIGMRSIVFALYFFLILSAGASAQIIENAGGTAFTDDNFFNASFIRNNKIQVIRGSVSTKREGEAMIKRDQFFHYEFDKQGRITKMMSTFASYSSNRDTTIILFHYNERGLLATKRRNDNNGFYSYNFEYDTMGRVVKETYCRDENCGPDRYHFKLGQQFVISSETYTYHQYVKNQRVKKFYNNYGLQYQEEFSYYNELGYLTEEVLRLTLSGKESKILYEYDEKGRVSKKSDVSYIFGYNEISNTYTYDKFGNLEEQSIFHNGKQKTLRSLLYDKNTYLMNAQVMKDFETGLIYIFRYSYEFYN